MFKHFQLWHWNVWKIFMCKIFNLCMNNILHIYFRYFNLYKWFVMKSTHTICVFLQDEQLFYVDFFWFVIFLICLIRGCNPAASGTHVNLSLFGLYFLDYQMDFKTGLNTEKTLLQPYFQWMFFPTLLCKCHYWLWTINKIYIIIKWHNLTLFSYPSYAFIHLK